MAIAGLTYECLFFMHCLLLSAAGVFYMFDQKCTQFAASESVTAAPELIIAESPRSLSCFGFGILKN